MKTKRRNALMATLLHAALAVGVHAQTHVITYQGKLTEAGIPVNGLYDFSFELFNDPVAGSSWATATNTAVPVSNGLFTVQIDVGPGVFDGADLWLEIGAVTNGGGPFTILSPRQPITSAPYAIQATTALSVDSGAASLELSVYNIAALRIQPIGGPGGLQPSIVAGHISNQIDPFVRGSVIAGGGIQTASHSITGLDERGDVIGGGTDNHIAYSSDAVISGGYGNQISTNADYSFIAGGSENEIGVGAFGAFAAGRRAKANHSGSFVWADSQNADFASTTNDQFNIRAGGGVRIETSGAGMTVDGEAVFAGTDGSVLQSLDASQLTSGTLPGSRLSGTYSSEVTLDNIGNDFTGVFHGDPFDFAAAPGFSWSADSDTGMFRSGSDELALSTAGTERFNITAQGNVSIGMPGGSNDGSLHVQNTSGASRPIKCDRVDTDGQLLAWARDDGVVGSVTVAGGVVSYNAFTGSHYAWCEEEPEPGMLMVLTGQNRPLHPDRPSEVVYGVEPCSRENDPACLGAYVSTTPMGEAAQDRPIRLVAAVGNGDLWVVDTGRDIRPGDLLIASAIPGCARLDDPGEFPVGHVIARAAQAVDWSEVQADSEGVKRSRISILFEAFVRDSRGAPERVAHLEARVAELEALVSELSGNTPQMLAENGTRTGDDR